MADIEPSPESPGGTRCAVVAVLGAPNAGKSTFVNAAVGTKVSIVSPKVQTTRTRVRGIALRGPAQLIFIDTPGIFAPRRRLDRAMVASAWAGAADADRVLLLVDARAGFTDQPRSILERLADASLRCDLALTKVDLVRPPSLLALSAEINARGIVDSTFMIASTTGSGLDALLDHLAAQAPAGPWLFPEDDVSDMPMRLLAAEITREKLFVSLHQELPYAATVETETWEARQDGSVRIEQTIYVQRDSQKAIVLGRGGQQIKRIGAQARAELVEILEQPVHLFLFVKVREDWGDDPDRYRQWGLDFNA